MTYAIAVAAAKTSTGNQDITTAALSGVTPKGVIFIYSRSPSDGTVAADAAGSFGAADGTNQFSNCTFSRDAMTTTFNYPFGDGYLGDRGSKTTCIAALKASGASLLVHSEASFVSFIANGVRINWTTAAADGWLVTAIFFAGSSISFACGSMSEANGTTATVGFEPSVVLLSGRGDPMGGVIQTGSRCRWSFGGSGWKGNIQSAAFGHSWAWSLNGQRLTQFNGNATPSAAGIIFDVNGFSIGIASRNTTSFTIYSGGLPADEWGYVAIKIVGADIVAGTLQLTASSGAQAFTGLGVAPELVFLFPGPFTVDNNPGFIGCIGVVAMTSAKVGGFASASRSSAGGTTPTYPTIEHSTACNDTITTLNEAGTVNSVATLASLDSDGLTLDFSNAPDLGWSWAYLAFGPPSGSGAGTERVQAWIVD